MEKWRENEGSIFCRVILRNEESRFSVPGSFALLRMTGAIVYFMILMEYHHDCRIGYRESYCFLYFVWFEGSTCVIKFTTVYWILFPVDLFWIFEIHEGREVHEGIVDISYGHCEGRSNPMLCFFGTWIATSFVTWTDSFLAMTNTKSLKIFFNFLSFFYCQLYVLSSCIIARKYFFEIRIPSEIAFAIAECKKCIRRIGSYSGVGKSA
jgi:hypothetical protein